jgi:osmotically-inducible protein OsmY
MKILLAALLTAALAGFGCGAPAAGDAEITGRVKERLAADSDTGGLQLNIETAGGVVTLSGTAATQIEKDKAEQIATHTLGVTQVINRITIAPAPAATPGSGEAAAEEKKTAQPQAK